jgi:hypothetical protein
MELSKGNNVVLDQPDQVSTLLNEMQKMVQRAVAMGEKAPKFDLCKVSVPDSNLFCQDNIGVPRVKMPQLKGMPIAGSKADDLPKNRVGKVDISQQFIKQMKAEGHEVTKEKIRASYLRASQSQIDGARIAQLVQESRQGDRDLREKPIFVTKDNYVLDGHHHWAADVGEGYEHGKDYKIPVYKLDMQIGEAIKAANDFAKSWGIAPKAVTNMDALGNVMAINTRPKQQSDVFGNEYVVNPFASEEQRRFMWANHPEIAEAWAHGEHTSDKDHKMPEEDDETHNYDPDQPRDEGGRWSGGGGPAGDAWKGSQKANDSSKSAFDAKGHLGQATAHQNAAQEHIKAGDAHREQARQAFAKGDKEAFQKHYTQAENHHKAAQYHQEASQRHTMHLKPDEFKSFSGNKAMTTRNSAQTYRDETAPARLAGMDVDDQRRRAVDVLRRPHDPSILFDGGHRQPYDDYDLDPATATYSRDPKSYYRKAMMTQPTDENQDTNGELRVQNAALDFIVAVYNRDWPQEKRDKLDDEDFAGPERSFPITSQEDLDAAVSSIGRSKHPASTIKAGIKRIAGKKNLKLPDSWEENCDTPMTKNVKTCDDCGAPIIDGKCVKCKKAVSNFGGMYSPASPDDPHAASMQAAHGSLDTEHADSRKPALAALDHSGNDDSKKAAAAHVQAADAHEAEATDQRKQKNFIEADQHDRAAAAHRKAASLHSATLNRRSEDMATKIATRQLAALAANCSCERTKAGITKVLNELGADSAEGSFAGKSTDAATAAREKAKQKEEDDEDDTSGEGKRGGAEAENKKIGVDHQVSHGGKILSNQEKEWLKTAPPAIRSVVENALAAEENVRQQLIVQLVGNSTGKRAEALKAHYDTQPLKVLRLLASNVPSRSEPLYVGANSPTDNYRGGSDDDQDILEIPTINYVDISKERQTAN